MKKIIKKFWGVALVVMMLSSLFIATIPASAAAYAFSDAAVLPTVASGVLAPAGNDFIDVAESGDVIFAIGLAGGANTLYKSVDGGATWANAGGATLPATGLWKYVAVAPDDPLYVVVVNNPAAAYNDTVYLSTNGGASFALLNALAPGTEINTVDISPLSTARYIVVGGSSAAAAAPVLVTWTIGGFAWTAIAGLPAVDDVVAVKYSPTFADEEDLLVVTETAATDVSLNIYSYPSAYGGWNNVAPGWPRILEAGAVTCNRATIELDETFYANSNEIGFIGASILVAAAEVGGVYSVAGAQILILAAGVNSVAWDGINLMVAPYATTAGTPITIYRSANQGATTFLGSTAFKTPGTGTFPLVIFSGGNGYCFSQGQNSAVAMTTDLGASFNGIKLVNSTFGNMIDFWIKSDASAIYAMTADGTTNVLWQRSAGVWTRILIFTGANYNVGWLVRAADGDTNAVFLAKKTARNVVYSLNSGDTWTTKFTQKNIADLAAQSASTIYYASDENGGVYKGTVGTSIAWTNLGALTGATTCYSITLVPGGFAAGAKNGVVGYYNGTALTSLAAFGATPVVVTASGTATGDTIYAASNGVVVGFGSWTIGTSAAWTAIIAAVPCTGVAYANGVAYAYNDAADRLYRFLPGAGLDTITGAGTEIFDQTNMVNSLQMTTGSNTLWARDAVAGVTADTIQSYTEYLLSAKPTLTYPVNGAIIPVNSINGVISAFNFQWAAPVVTALPAGTSYTLFISYDAVGAMPLNGVGGTAVGATTNWNSAAFTGAFTPGTTYYWSVQITGPTIKSLPAARGSFTIQQLSAIVPVISSPINGSSVETLIPAFSWEPIAGVTGYTFELAKEPEFVLMVYTANTTTSSAAMPVALRLTDGETYFWRVKALTPAEGEWSQVGIFTVAIPVPPTTPAATPTVTATTTSTVYVSPTLTVVVPTTTPVVEQKISPAYIWAIIIIGAVLVIAVIVLIVRTRRTV